MEVHTTGEYIYDTVHLMVMDKHHFIFKVKANHSAHIALCEIPGNINTRAFEVGIQTGSNDQSFIRMGVKSGTKLMTANTPDMLTPLEWKTFWMSWTDNVGFIDCVVSCRLSFLLPSLAFHSWVQLLSRS